MTWYGSGRAAAPPNQAAARVVGHADNEKAVDEPLAFLSKHGTRRRTTR